MSVYEVSGTNQGLAHRSDDPFLIHVCHRPAISNSIMNGQITSLIISKTKRSIVDSPVIVQSAIQTLMVCLPAIGSSCHTLCGFQPIATQIVQVPGFQVLGCGVQRAVNVLLPDRNSIVDQGVGIRESTHTLFSVNENTAASSICATYPAIVPK